MKKLLIPVLLFIYSCAPVSVKAQEITENQFYIRYEYYKKENINYINDNISSTEIIHTYLTVYYIDSVYIEETPDEWTYEVINNEPNWSLFIPEIIFYRTKEISYQFENSNIFVNINYSVVKLNNI